MTEVKRATSIEWKYEEKKYCPMTLKYSPAIRYVIMLHQFHVVFFLKIFESKKTTFSTCDRLNADNDF